MSNVMVGSHNYKMDIMCIYNDVIVICPPIVLFPLPLVIVRAFRKAQLITKRHGKTTPDLQSRYKKVISPNGWQRRSWLTKLWEGVKSIKDRPSIL